MSTYKPGIDDEDEDEVWGGQEQYDKLMDDILNPKYEKFSYNANSDLMYKQYEQAYTRNAKAARENTQAAMQSMSGGYGNSYAGVAAQQSYNQQMDKLNDVIPQLEQQAYQRYSAERDVQRQDNLNALKALNTDRGQWWTEKKYGDAQKEKEENNIISITEDMIESKIYDGTPEGEDALRAQLAIHGLDEDTVETIVGHVINTWTTGNTILERDEAKQEEIEDWIENNYEIVMQQGGELTEQILANLRAVGWTEKDIKMLEDQFEAKKEEREAIVESAVEALLGMNIFNETGGWAYRLDMNYVREWLMDEFDMTNAEAGRVINEASRMASLEGASNAETSEQTMSDLNLEVIDLINRGEITSWSDLDAVLENRGLKGTDYEQRLRQKFAEYQQDQGELDEQALSDANLEVIDLINGGKITSVSDLDAVLENLGLKGTDYEQRLRQKFAEYQAEYQQDQGELDEQALSDANLEVIDLINGGKITSVSDLDAVLENRGLKGTDYEQRLRQKFAEYQHEQSVLDAQMKQEMAKAEESEYKKQVSAWLDATENGDLNASQVKQILADKESGKLSEEDYNEIVDEYSEPYKTQVSSGKVFVDSSGAELTVSQAKAMVDNVLDVKLISESVKKELVKKYNDKYAIYKCANSNGKPWKVTGVGDAIDGFTLHYDDDEYTINDVGEVSDKDVLAVAAELDELTVFAKGNAAYIKGDDGKVYEIECMWVDRLPIGMNMDPDTKNMYLMHAIFQGAYTGVNYG